MSGSEAKWTFAQNFHVDFNAAASELASRLDALKSSGADVLPATMQSAALDLSLLAKNLSDATGSLPSYDQRQCELQLKALERSLEELRGTSASVPKFSFKRRTKPKPSTECTPVAVTGPQPTVVESARTLAAFSHRYLTILDVHSSNPSAGVSVSDLEDCVVNLLPNDENHIEITALHVHRVSRSVILLPRISGSIMLHELCQCVIVVGCHQFRMHNSTAVDVYLESGSDPIIESCLGIRFAAYPSSLVRGAALQDGKYLSVRDFSHILPTPSPNWGVLTEQEWERSWPILILGDQALQEELERMLPAHARPLTLENDLRA